MLGHEVGMAKDDKDLMSQEDEVRRWTAKRRAALVRASSGVRPRSRRRHGSMSSRLPRSRAGRNSLCAMENALRSRPKDEEALKDEQIRNLQARLSWRTGTSVQNVSPGFAAECVAGDSSFAAASPRKRVEVSAR